jgi:hypothetical protein
MIIRSLRGTEGKVVVPGLGAVVATFSDWTLRREENGRAGPRWSLHAALSYRNESLLKNESLTKKFICVLSKEQKFEFCSYDRLVVEGITLFAEGVNQCE